ncbi:diguanylate cyclase [Massilia sp. BJB1822]|uniref:diguanylate cyclase n=1 Tax=Massilia sp. BJB1822 TaxID=2744470 RepID=UPI0035A5D4CA
MVELFVLDEDVARCEADLPVLQGVARLRQLVRLAWHLRQRDLARAQALAADAAALLPMAEAAERRLLAARLQLLDSEWHWLHGELAAAQALAEAALLEYELLDDALGRADARCQLASVAVDCGDAAQCERQLAIASADARAAGDAMRADVVDAATALFSVFRDAQGTAERWRQRFGDEAQDAHPAVAGWISDFLGTSAFQSADFGRGISHLMAGFDAALASGQLRRAIILATNIGNGFTSLNAHDAALEWLQRGFDLARPTGWPLSIGLCQMQTAETLRQLGQREAAQTLLHKALQTLLPLPDSRAYAVALEYQGDLALDLEDYDGALTSFAQLEERGAALGQSDFQSAARRGKAHALSQQGRPREAQQAACSALSLARASGDVCNQIAALRVLAQIHEQHALPAPESLSAPNAVLHYLDQALALAAAIEGYTVPWSLLDTAAREYAAIGDYQRAYGIALQASAARDKTHSQDATNRAIAMQVQYRTERAQTEGEHHRQLAAAEAQRAAVLQQTNATLAHLSAIGQEITAHLDADAVFRALDRHVHGLLDATHFSVFLLEPDGQHLRCAFGVEAGQPLPATRYALADQQANSVRSLRERREILVELEADALTPNLIPGTLPTLTLLFAPLTVGERVLGVMTVQSLQARAYGERERLIFGTLCAYGAIALDNAATQAELLDKNLELQRAYQALEEVSLTDQLTGLRNRRFFLQHVDADVALSLRRYDEPSAPPLAERGEALPDKDLVFFLVDLDHFKEVNDSHGHGAGDAVLVQMQERLREVFRESDYLVRWGGEEFLVLARATHRDEGKQVAERIRQAVAGRPFTLPDGSRLDKTCSIGFACFPFLPAQPRLLNWSQVVELADQALYIAKNSGRNGWAALYSTPSTRPEQLFSRLVHRLDRALDEDQVRLLRGPRS